MYKIDIKPLSVNEVWKGKRFKTNKYKSYELEMIFLLPKIEVPKPPFKVYYEFGMSSSLSDWDNPIKPFQDILQKKYGIDDRDIFEANVKKFKTKKGQEYIKFEISNLQRQDKEL